VDPDYAIHYRSLYQNHWWWRARENFILATIEEMQHGVKSTKILDVGCGDGLLFEHLSKFGDVEGVECDGSLLADNSQWREKIYVSPFDARFQPGKRYSLILMLDVLEHVSDPRKFLRCALRLLESNGTVILTVPAFPILWTSHDDMNRHFRRYTKKSLAELASQSDMRILSCQYFFHWTFPLKLALHFKEMCFGGRSQVPDVPPPWINETLLRLSIAEQKFLRNARVPFGSSIIAIGQKQKPLSDANSGFCLR
jgi:SAM-dependent methyltransferase